MVLIFFSYDLIVRDMFKFLNCVVFEGLIKCEIDYFNINIFKVMMVDGFMGDYCLYFYVMKVYGFDDMIYVKVFMKKVLDSDFIDL